MKQGFEDYLREVYSKEYVGVDDDMEDSFVNWMITLDMDEWISYAEKWHEKEIVKNT